MSEDQPPLLGEDRIVMPRPLFDCFVVRGGEEHICEVYEASDGFVSDFAVFTMREDGSKNKSILEDGFEDEVQNRYHAWITFTMDDDVI